MHTFNRSCTCRCRLHLLLQEEIRERNCCSSTSKGLVALEKTHYEQKAQSSTCPCRTSHQATQRYQTGEPRKGHETEKRSRTEQNTFGHHNQKPAIMLKYKKQSHHRNSMSESNQGRATAWEGKTTRNGSGNDKRRHSTGERGDQAGSQHEETAINGRTNMHRKVNDPASNRISARLHHQKRSKHRVKGLIHKKSLIVINQQRLQRHNKPRRLLAFRRDKRTHEDRPKDVNQCSFETSAGTFTLKLGACSKQAPRTPPKPAQKPA